MSDLALIALLVPLGTLIILGLFGTVAMLFEASVRKEIGQ